MTFALSATLPRQPVAPPALERLPVWSCNEWDLLEEVIVGSAAGARWPSDQAVVTSCVPLEHLGLLRQNAGKPMPLELVNRAEEELEGLCETLRREGVVVRRPDSHAHDAPFSTPDWISASGLYSAMPRDVALVVGDTIIEAPMAWRCRHFEINAYRKLFREYFDHGARWIAAPRPVLRDELYHTDTSAGAGAAPGTVTNLEPVFDAADFIRLGNLVVGQLSNVTNELGVRWLQRHLPTGYRVELIEPVDSKPMHIDATLIPLAPGKLLVNPDRLPVIPELFSEWEVRSAPRPSVASGPPLYLSSGWVSMNLLSIDCQRVLVERQETELIAMLKKWGFQPIPLPFRHFQALGGSFHCATLDVRRQRDNRVPA